jgi:hypothetical protein
VISSGPITDNEDTVVILPSKLVLGVLALEVAPVLGADGTLFFGTPAHEVPIRHLKQPAITDTHHIEPEGEERVRDARRDILVSEDAYRHPDAYPFAALLATPCS